ncbi:MAG: PIG-L family deacetylase [Candidatus Harrisonbacteria bacterium]|nr:PIG-L family deacetylase [Candidatus Harrisonbacteria bacterium]
MKENKKSVLVISAHPDDEAFGCLGVLLKHSEAGDKINFQWFTGGRDEKQFEGMKKLANLLNAEYANENLADQELDALPIKKLISIAEAAVQKHKPDIVYTNFIGDLNKDHRLVSEAVMVACRPYRTITPKEVWMFEVPGTTELGIRPFVADKSVEINKADKENKMRLCYEQEMINGRESVQSFERFEKWPKLQ